MKKKMTNNKDDLVKEHRDSGEVVKEVVREHALVVD